MKIKIIVLILVGLILCAGLFENFVGFIPVSIKTSNQTISIGISK